MDGKSLDQILRMNHTVVVEGFSGPINEYEIIYVDEVRQLIGNESEIYLNRLLYDNCIKSCSRQNNREAYIVSQLGLSRELSGHYENLDKVDRNHLYVRKAAIWSAIFAGIAALCAIIAVLSSALR